MREAPTFLPVTEQRTRVVARGSSDSIVTSAPRRPLRATPRPAVAAVPAIVPAPVAQPVVGPFVPLPGGGASFDPLRVPMPPELAAPVYGWLRRLALQADLPGADLLLRDAVADLTGSLSVIVIYAGPDGPTTLGGDDELPADPQPVQLVAQTRHALVGPHAALVPIATPTETIAVLQLTRNPHQSPYGLVEHVTMAAIARESANIMHHLVVQHWVRRQELDADRASLYRPEALESHRRRGDEGVLAELSPAWIRRAYPVLAAIMAVALVFAVFVHVPTYSSGSGVVVYKGMPVVAEMPGTVEEVYVQPGEHVQKGDVLAKLVSAKEDADLAQARTELDGALQQYLFDTSDESIRKALIGAQAQVKRAEAAVAERAVRAPTDGTLSDVFVRPGAGVQFGDPILTIVEPGTLPEIWALLPGQDRPRLRPGQPLQVALTGFSKGREIARIYEVGRDVIGAVEARRILGPELAGAVKIGELGSYVLVKARLARPTFESEHRTYHYYQGMPAKTEVKVDAKRFLTSLIPSLDKYL